MPPASRLGKQISEAATALSAIGARFALMKSSVKHDALLAADGGLGPAPARVKDPYRALDDLMAAVEALCPVMATEDRAPTITRRMLRAELGCFASSAFTRSERPRRSECGHGLAPGRGAGRLCGVMAHDAGFL